MKSLEEMTSNELYALATKKYREEAMAQKGIITKTGTIVCDLVCTDEIFNVLSNWVLVPPALVVEAINKLEPTVKAGTKVICSAYDGWKTLDDRYFFTEEEAEKYIACDPDAPDKAYTKK